MPEFTRAGVSIDYAVAGPDEGRPLLLIMGLGMQRVGWPEAFLQALAARGFRVITFDNRDVGLSTRYEGAAVPSLGAMFGARLLGRDLSLPYRLDDIADDAVALLDHLGIGRADVLGISMGGMIAMHIAARHSARVGALILMATSSGRLGLPPPRARILSVAATRPPPGGGIDAATDYMVRMFTAIGSPAWRMEPEEIRRRARRQAERAPRGTGIYRQMAAIAADGDRTPMLRKLRVPTLVIHGEADPMVPPAHGRQLARSIPNARLEPIEGWGHDLPDALAPRFAELIERHCQAANSR